MSEGEAPRATPPVDLPRRLGPFDATTIVVGSMIGSGVFLKAATIARRLPDPRLAVLVWAAAGLLSFLGALAIAELGAMRPRSGGLYAALHDELGPFAGFLFGWSLLAVLQTGSIAGLAAGIVERALSPYMTLSTTASTLLAGTLVVAFSALNVVSVRAASNVQGALTVAKCLGLLALVFGGFVVAEGSMTNLARVGAPPPGDSWASAFGLAMIGALWAYDGWVNVSFVAGELREPQRHLPRALLIGTTVVTGLYLLANLAYHWVLPLPTLQNAKNPARELARQILGEGGGIAITVLVTASALGTLMSSILSGPRVFFAMARDGLFFRKVASVHPRFATPHVAIVLQCAWALALLLRWRTFDALTDNVVFIYWIFYGLGAVSVLVSRRHHPDAARPYRTPAYPLVPVVFLVGATLLVGNTVYASLIHGTSAALEALGLLAVGALLYPVFRCRT
ncbi:MAG: amino acid permease [Deltaproteobacteria bacterium]|nr:amino acid permease [Deltaproteobacteria bacterium]